MPSIMAPGFAVVFGRDAPQPIVADEVMAGSPTRTHE